MSEMVYLDADAAASTLGVSRATLYAYVSRGLVRSAAHPSDPRKRRYAAADLARLLRRRAQRARPDAAAVEALHWGAPVLDSAITRIADGRCHHRGRELTELAAVLDIEAMARLLWMGDAGPPPGSDDPFAPANVPSAPQLRGLVGWPDGAALPLAERMTAALAIAGTEDLAAWDPGPVTLAASGARIMRLLAALAAGATDPQAPGADPSGTVALAARQGIARALARAWGLDAAAARAIDAALVLSADQELNVSAFTVRCVASAGSTAYACVQAGLAALQGPRHGGHVWRVAALLRAADGPAGLRPLLRERLQRGEAIPGFGHPLYPAGDPRGRMLLELARQLGPTTPTMRLVDALVAELEAMDGRRPTLDLGLVALVGVLALPTEAAFALFAVGRCAGWIAHAIEQVEDGRLIRPRARYVGLEPEPTEEAASVPAPRRR